MAVDGIAISVLTYLEAIEGLRGSHEPLAADHVLQQFLQAAPMFGISPLIAERAASIRIDLRRQKRQVNHRALDILIAATAIEHSLSLVTRNIRDYADIPDLVIFQSEL